jgi:hypothetical protein
VSPLPPAAPPTAIGQSAAPGTAAIIGRTGCQRAPFRVQVRGTAIRTVTFQRDGKRVATLTRPNRGTRYSLLVTPSALRVGTHRVTATVRFTLASGTRAKTMRIVFRRCA